MDVPPQMYRNDIERTRAAIASWCAHAEALSQQLDEPGKEAIEYTRLQMYISDAHWHQDRLRIQLEALQRGLARAQGEWAAAQEKGAGVRLGE